MIKLSKRLEAVAALVTPGSRLCDVGTDHGYIPIYLVQKGAVARALAMDVNEGPLLRAREHIAAQGLESYIDTRRSDGLAAMRDGECDSVVLAGMGGSLVIRILEDSFAKLEAVKELILQPQSDIELVRHFVAEHGLAIDRQDMVEEDGKYYMMFRCMHSEERTVDTGAVRKGTCRLACDRYGEQLILQNHPVLKEYLDKEERLILQIQESLQHGKNHGAALRRQEELAERQRVIAAARTMMEEAVENGPADNGK